MQGLVECLGFIHVERDTARVLIKRMNMNQFMILKALPWGPDWCGAVGWLSSCKVAGSILSQGTCLGCGPGLQEGACESQLINVSLAH